MKNIYIYTIAALSILSCDYKEDSLTGSNLETGTPQLSDTDNWLRENYALPYNINVIYEWDEGRVDLNRYLHPPFLENVIPAMEAIKTIWIDGYSQTGGEDFIKEIAPREIVLIGGLNLNENGTRTLGFAEGGKNIVFFEVDLIDYTSRNSVVRFIQTIQHEYTHILNQTVRFDETAFQQITPGDYTAQWFNPANGNERLLNAYKLGFITDYARLNHTEDFAEMVATMLSNSPADYNTLINNIRQRIVDDEVGSNPTTASRTRAEGRADEIIDLIRQKEAIVADYYARELNIDIYELQRIVSENVSKVIQ